MTRTLLIADDATIIREIIKSTVHKSGWTVVAEAVNGQEAIDRYAELKPDAVTLDLVMPQYDGMYALRAIMQANPTAKILVVSAVDQKSILKEAFRLGATDFVVKPFAKQALLSTLEKMVPCRDSSDAAPSQQAAAACSTP